MRFRRTLAEPEEPIELNLIPLIDVIMFLLIFFISTTSFLELPGVPVDKPQAVSAQQMEMNSIIFAVTAEEYGLIACLILLALFAFIVLRGLSKASQEPDGFIRHSRPSLTDDMLT